jgi:hypothetical protein
MNSALMNWDSLFDDRCPLCGRKFDMDCGDRVCTAHAIKPFRITAERYLQSGNASGFPDAKGDQEACVFQCVACRIIETITEARSPVPFKQAS